LQTVTHDTDTSSSTTEVCQSVLSRPSHIQYYKQQPLLLSYSAFVSLNTVHR